MTERKKSLARRLRAAVATLARIAGLGPREEKRLLVVARSPTHAWYLDRERERRDRTSSARGARAAKLATPVVLEQPPEPQSLRVSMLALAGGARAERRARFFAEAREVLRDESFSEFDRGARRRAMRRAWRASLRAKLAAYSAYGGDAFHPGGKS